LNMDVCILAAGVTAVFVSLYVIVKIIGWLSRAGYHHLHPEKRSFKRGLAKAVLKKRYGRREGKRIFKELASELWDKHKIK